MVNRLVLLDEGVLVVGVELLNHVCGGHSRLQIQLDITPYYKRSHMLIANGRP